MSIHNPQKIGDKPFFATQRDECIKHIYIV